MRVNLWHIYELVYILNLYYLAKIYQMPDYSSSARTEAIKSEAIKIRHTHAGASITELDLEVDIGTYTYTPLLLLLVHLWQIQGLIIDSFHPSVRGRTRNSAHRGFYMSAICNNNAQVHT